MNIYFAPMEGITGYIFRNAVQRHFPFIDKYYAPFIQPNPKRVFVPKEERDILPEHNEGIPLVPQVLTCSADGFVRAGHALEAYGYQEVNLNLGCPSGTVVSKGKGAGMLVDSERLKAFFEEVFSADWKAKITVKTRLGLTEKDDFTELMEVFQSFPIDELTIHARYRTDFYKGQPRMEEFKYALAAIEGQKTNLTTEEMGSATMGICYNGNIFTKIDYDRLIADYQSSVFKSVMLGRGLLANPALAREIKGGAVLEKEELRSFHDDILDSYCQLNFGEKNTIFKMKELWNYWGTVFMNAPKELKKIRKAERFSEYIPAVDALFRDGELTESRSYQP